MDALQAFLGADLDVKEEVKIKRLGVALEIKAITTKKLQSLTSQATFGKNVDEMKLNGLIVAAACTNLNFGDAKLLEKYEASDAGDCVTKALLPGELLNVVKVVMTASGFDDFDDQVKSAKN
ncbi:hypothetical protein AB1282_00260 [Gottfriedia sp. S16(2024)]|uniref:phage tail assembly chaperone n=1 Tax=Gottfriedia sp. S16(2024) TaxID=3162883 RepID=UPI003D2065BA